LTFDVLIMRREASIVADVKFKQRRQERLPATMSVVVSVWRFEGAGRHDE